MPALEAYDTIDLLQRLASSEPKVLEGFRAFEARDALDTRRLSPRAHGVAKLAALVATGAPADAYLTQVTRSLDSGLAIDDLFGVLVAVAPQVGYPCVITAAAEVVRALELLDVIDNDHRSNGKRRRTR